MCVEVPSLRHSERDLEAAAERGKLIIGILPRSWTTASLDYSAAILLDYSTGLIR